jgi:uncharacterized sulfatase
MRGKDAVGAARDDLRKALADDAPAVRIAAAEALGQYGSADDLNEALPVLLELAPLKKNGVYVSMEALNALDALGKKAAPGLAVIKGAAKGSDSLSPRIRNNVPLLVEHVVTEIER